VRFLALVMLVTLARGSASAVVAAEDTEADTTSEPMSLSLSLYIVVEAGAGPSSELSSARDTASMEEVLLGMQAIWDQADIELVVGPIVRIAAPADALIDLGQGDMRAFLNGVYERSIEVPDPGSINGFYIKSLGKINGVASVGTHVFFVTDEPSVHDERVSSHEIGHILGLHHDTADSGHLMFSGTNGVGLSVEEIATARYVAQGIIDGLR